MRIRIRTLTPLWTGGVGGAMNRLHPTGIIGSLRWWYEAIVRGLGGDACDPTDHRCAFDQEQYARSTSPELRGRLRDAGLCDACQVFGATGWRRRFSLAVKEDDTHPLWSDPRATLNIRPPRRHRGWFLAPGRMGRFTLDLRGDRNTLALLAHLILYLERFGTLGARPQLGYGAFAVENRAELLQRARESSWNRVEGAAPDPWPSLPDLRDFLFFRFTFQPSRPGWWTSVPGVARVASRVQPLVGTYRIAPTTPALKNAWRFQHWQRPWGDDRDIFGTLRPKRQRGRVATPGLERQRGRVAATWAYRLENPQAWAIHGWAWMPPARARATGHLFRLLTNAGVWQNTLGVPGTLVHTPPAATWTPRTSGQVKDLLDEVTR